MTKQDLVDRIAKGTGIPKIDTAAVLEGFFRTVVQAMYDHQRIEIRGFGTFQTKSRRASTGRNPRTGEAVSIPAKIVPVFKFSKEVKNLVK